MNFFFICHKPQDCRGTPLQIVFPNEIVYRLFVSFGFKRIKRFCHVHSHPTSRERPFRPDTVKQRIVFFYKRVPVECQKSKLSFWPSTFSTPFSTSKSRRVNYSSEHFDFGDLRLTSFLGRHRSTTGRHDKSTFKREIKYGYFILLRRRKRRVRARDVYTARRCRHARTQRPFCSSTATVAFVSRPSENNNPVINCRCINKHDNNTTISKQ